MRAKVFIHAAQISGTIAIVAAIMFIVTAFEYETQVSAKPKTADALSIEMISVEGNSAVKSFNIGKYEVTQGQWNAVMGNNPAGNKSGDNYPVEMVSWTDVKAFISKLNALTEKNYRLPSEAEWEYAARGGNKSQGYDFSGSNNINDVAWYYSNSDNRTHAVGGKKPNELGIHDMSGNVWEWCEDSSGSLRAIRGGGWDAAALGCGVAGKNYNTLGERHPGIGFRLAHP